MNKTLAYKLLKYSIAGVWLINGLYCKVLNQVPRHREIVGEILGEDFAAPLTILIGISEIIMTIWVLSGFKSRLNTLIQIVLVAVMNVMEFVLVPDLLLWGKLNALFALGFILILYYYEFVLKAEASREQTT
ncbi:MAG: DoxX-like family protein [Bacteroidota bacterium]